MNRQISNSRRAFQAAAIIIGLAPVLVACSSSPKTAKTSDSSENAPATASTSQVSLYNARSAVLYVNGLSCPLCATNIDKSMRKLPGVADAAVDLSEGTVTLSFTTSARPSQKQIEQTVKDSGFTLVRIEPRS